VAQPEGLRGNTCGAAEKESGKVAQQPRELRKWPHRTKFGVGKTSLHLDPDEVKEEFKHMSEGPLQDVSLTESTGQEESLQAAFGTSIISATEARETTHTAASPSPHAISTEIA